MATSQTPPIQEGEKHFNKIYWFVVLFSFAILVFMGALIFLPIPKENTHNGDMTLSFLFGLLTGTTGVLIITNPNQRKETMPPGTTSHQVTETITETPTAKGEQNITG